MIEIWAAVVGVALTAVVGFVVYSYRAVITYELTSIDSDPFRVVDSKVEPAGDWRSIRVTCERLKLRNRGFVGIDAPKITVERTPALLGFDVDSTTSVPKGSVQVNQAGNELTVSIDHFPRSEEVILQWSYVTVSRFNEWRNVKGAGRKFKIRQESTYQLYRRGWKAAGDMLIIGTLVGIILARG